MNLSCNLFKNLSNNDLAAGFIKYVRRFADGIGAHPDNADELAQPRFSMAYQPPANALTS